MGELWLMRDGGRLDRADVLRARADFAQAANVVATLTVRGHGVEHFGEYRLKQSSLLRRERCQGQTQRRSSRHKHAFGEPTATRREMQGDESLIGTAGSTLYQIGRGEAINQPAST